MKYYDPTSVGVIDDDGYAIEGYESLWGTSYYCGVYDSAVLSESEVPTNADEFLEFCKAHPGKCTYPALPDFNGSWFVRTLVMDLLGADVFAGMDETTTYDEMKGKIEPALAYLRELNPYLWSEGKTYPPTNAAAIQMFADGELMFFYNSPWAASSYIKGGTIQTTARSFAFDNTIAGHHYLTIAYDCPNIAGALVMCDEWLTPECVAERTTIGQVPPTDCMILSEMSTEQVEAIESADGGVAAIPLEEYVKRAVPNMPASAVAVFEEIWEKEVAGQSNN
jgi:putative spermidine/putrescine transport system substrate-binding protein